MLEQVFFHGRRREPGGREPERPGEVGMHFLLRLAAETGVVLLPGSGFDVSVPSARVSLANLTDHEYRAIGTATRRIVEEYYGMFSSAGSAGAGPSKGSKP